MLELGPIEATKLVLHIIDDWLKSNGAGSLKADKTIKDNPPKGYEYK